MSRQYRYDCLRMMILFHEYFQIGVLITNTNPLDTQRLKKLKQDQNTCLIQYNVYSNYTLDYENSEAEAEPSNVRNF